MTSKLANKSVDDLETIHDRIEGQIGTLQRKVKRHVSMDAEYWEWYYRIERLRRNKTLVNSRIQREIFEECRPDKDWYDEREAETSKLKYNGQKHIVSIVSKQITRLRDQNASDSESWFRHFTASRISFDLPLSESKQQRKSERHKRDLKERRKAFESVYGANKGLHWCPVVQTWGNRACVKTAHLFPRKQVDSIDDIFGQGASEEIFTPLNGLFLSTGIESALHKGVIAFVPDVDLEPADTNNPFQDQQDRNDRLRAWKTGPVKEYKLVVMNKKSKAANEGLFDKDKYGFTTLLDLHGRKLEFKTDFRPRTRYVWWAFLSAVMCTAYVQHTPFAQDMAPWDIQELEIRKAIRCWGTQGRYMKRSLMLGFIQERGKNVNSILDQAIDDEEDDEQPEPALVASIAFNAVTVRGEEEEDSDLEDIFVDDSDEEDSDEENYFEEYSAEEDDVEDYDEEEV